MNSNEIEEIGHEQSNGSLVGQALKTVALASAVAIAAAAIANAVIAWNTPQGGARLSGGFNRVPLRYGDAAYFVSGSGSPVLLLHAPYPGNSSDEWVGNFDALARQYTAYAFDFLGWGLSDKPRHLLRPDDYAEQIRHFTEDVIGAPCVVVASGAAGNLALLAAQEAPELFSRIVLICPTTTDVSEPVAAALEDESAGAENFAYRVLSQPIIGQAAANWLHSRASIEAGAKRNLFFDKSKVTPAAIKRLHVGAHQPGSQHALAAQASGLLTSDWSRAWSTLSVPALLVWGRNAPGPGIETAPEWLALNPEAHLEVFDEAMLLPHVEHADDFNARLLKWLSGCANPPAPAAQE